MAKALAAQRAHSPLVRQQKVALADKTAPTYGIRMADLRRHRLTPLEQILDLGLTASI